MTRLPDRTRVSSLRDRLQVAQAILLATIAVIPPFLVGALAVGIRAELGFGPAALGLAVAWFFVSTSLSASALGKTVESLGTRASLTLGATVSAAALGGAALAPTYPWLLVAMTAGGAANGLSQPAVNAMLAKTIPPHRLGLAFGIKQSSIPMATLLGGLAVPTLGMTIGWRGTFTVAATVAAISAVGTWLAGRGDDQPIRGRGRKRLRDFQSDLSSLVILTIGGTLAAAAATSVGAFLVDSAVTSGIPEGRAGLLFAAASAVGLTGRVLLGWFADSHPLVSRYTTITMLVIGGVPGFLLLATGVPALYLPGAILAYAAGWGWTGLFHYTVVSQNPETPAASTGIIQTGLSFGAGLGPLLLGSVVERSSYTVGWIGAAVLGAMGAGFFAYGRIHLRRRLSATATSTDVPTVVPSLRWTDGEARTAGHGISVIDQRLEDLSVSLLRLAPGAEWRARAATRASTLVVVDGGEVEFALGTTTSLAEAGQAVTLPPHLLWRARNLGDDEVTFAVILTVPRPPT
jgi:predicted MFS family arabinose efflux permease/quercetin dioxygenase-like cupin family protein